ncbi:SubName: Full=Uncharacterized protein {ECO:0000313/EMBL:CCA76892.1} [Serendipita indica DSM 11827]|nr:SubName: Full=Uncharacterized protein {ECO:0000313/EMBL:CCA76892.1} [Serendipita indica DSM 11827]
MPTIDNIQIHIYSDGMPLPEFGHKTSGERTKYLKATCYIPAEAGKPFQVRCDWNRRARHDWEIRTFCDEVAVETMSLQRGMKAWSFEKPRKMDISTGGEHEGTGNQDNNSLLKQTEIHERKKERFSHRITRIGQRLASEDRQLERIDASAAINDGSENDEGDGDIESGEELGRSNSLIPPYIRTKDKTPQSQEAVQGYPYAMFHLQR